MGLDELDDLAIPVGGGLFIAARFVDHAEPIVSIVDFGVAFQELARSPLGLLELAFVHHVDYGVGVAGEFVLFILGGATAEVALHVIVLMQGSFRGTGLRRGLQGNTFGLLVLRQAAALVLLPAAARAGIIASGLGHILGAAMCQLLSDAAFYRLLLRFDEDLAAAERPKGCWLCGKKLHVSDFRRKPRGLAVDLGDRFAERLSFCCADRSCRKRRTPPSLRFLGRKVYLGATVVLISAMRCGTSPTRMRRLNELVGVSRQTVSRWRRWWTEALPGSRFWAGAAGALLPPVNLAELPASLLERFAGSAAERLILLLRWLSPVSGGSPAAHAA